MMPEKANRQAKEAITFLLQHLVVGTAGGFVFGGLVLYYDVAGLGSLIWNSSEPWLALFLLFFGLFVTFGSLGMGWGVMALGRERD